MQLNPVKFYKNILKLAEKESFAIETIYNNKPAPIIALARTSTFANSLNIYISSGIHGNEPAGPLTIERLLAEGYFKDEINWHLIPMLNPQGLALGTRENADKIDLNRDYKAGKTKEVATHLEWLKNQHDIHYDLTINLHEDWESPGFYCYAIIPTKYQYFLDSIAESVRKFSPINLSEEIEGTKAKGGFIQHNIEDFDTILREWQDWPEAFFLIKNHPEAMHFTFETASMQPIEQRIDTQCAAIKTLIKELKKASAKTP